MYISATDIFSSPKEMILHLELANDERQWVAC